MLFFVRLALSVSAILLLARPGSTEQQSAPAPRPARSELGRSVKMRILVDKVMQPEADWHTEEWMVAEAAAAGFNVWSPRLGNDDLDEVQQVSAWCREQQIFHIPWMRGTLVAPEGPEADGKRVVWGSGSEQLLWSPNSDQLWDWMTKRILAYAQMAADDPTLIGVFLDYENYASGAHGGHLYDLSYDDLILTAFAGDRGIALPTLAHADRKQWLQEQGLHDAFEAFQVDHWRWRCRLLREAVDEIAPEFQFCIYPAPDTHFMTAATYPEWATPQAPLILADASIYGRPGTWAAHAQALSLNFDKLSERRTWALDQPGGPYMYAGGLDPVVKGADPEFTGRNAVLSADVSDGYWVFYEGPTYEGTHRQYFDWFTRANQAIEAGNLDFWREPRETPDTFGLTELVSQTDRPQLVLFDQRPHLTQTIQAMDLFEIHEMAGNGLSYLSGADVVILQNLNEEFGPEHPLVETLRQYVADGGGLLLGHDTAWFMASPVPEVATRGIPTENVEAGRHVVNTDLITGDRDRALGEASAQTQFSTEFYDHMIFTPGPEGRVIVRNTLGDPVYVAGTFGKGRILFSGCYYGYARPLEGIEAQVLDGALRWLAGSE